MSENDASKDTPRPDPTPGEGANPEAPGERVDAAPAGRRGRAGWIVAGGVAVLAAAYVGLAAWTGGRVPEGTTVAGIDVGGQEATEAHATLAQALPTVLTEPAAITVAGESDEIVPQSAGLGIDLDATVDRLTGFTLDPRLVVQRLTGGGTVPPVTTVDETMAAAAMERVALAHDRAPLDAAITLTEGRAEVTEPAEGIEVDVDASAREFASEWPATDPIELSAATTRPALDAADLEAAQRDIVDPLLSGPVELAAGDVTTQLEPATLTSVMSIGGEDDEGLVLTTDADALYGAVVDAEPQLANQGRDARITIENGAPTITPSEAGPGMDRGALAEAVQGAALSTEDRTARIELTTVEPDFTTEQAQALGVTEPIVEFATNLTNDHIRTQNLVVGSEKITNTLVKPGEEFSLLRTLGPISQENGFYSSGVIASGFTAEAVGGGLSQLSTNTFNAGWLGGMVDVEHQPHSRWYSRYPTGREATLWEGQIDMRWKNDTPYGVLVEAWVGGGQQHVRLWSTKYWDVKVWASDRYAFTSPQSRVNTARDCVPEGPGPSGFTIDNYRERWRDGVKVDEQKLTWTYNPWHAVTCG